MGGLLSNHVPAPDLQPRWPLSLSIRYITIETKEMAHIGEGWGAGTWFERRPPKEYYNLVLITMTKLTVHKKIVWEIYTSKWSLSYVNLTLNQNIVETGVKHSHNHQNYINIPKKMKYSFSSILLLSAIIKSYLHCPNLETI